MKKTGLVFILAALVLSAAAILLRLLELSTAIDADGLVLFRPVTVILALLSLAAAVFFFLFARRYGKNGGPSGSDYRSLGIPGVVWAVVCLLLQVYGAWLVFQGWKTEKDVLALILALMAGLAGAGWLFLRLGEWKNVGSAGARFLAGSLVTLFYGLWLVVYYRDNAANPTLLLTVYDYLALCACCVAACCITGGAGGLMKPVKTLVFCGLALYLSLVALSGAKTAYRLFWTAAALQFALSALMLLNPLDKPAPAEEEVPAEAETETPAAEETEGE